MADYQPVFAGDKGPPPGMSVSFWRDLMNSDYAKSQIAHFAKRGVDWYQGFVDNYATPMWNGLSPAQQTKYQEDDSEGNLDPWFTPEGKIAEEKGAAEAEKDRVEQSYEDWESEFMPGLREAMEGASAGDAAAIQRLNTILAGIEDPEIADYVGDYVSQAAQAGASQEAIDRQKGQFDKLNALSDPTMTAEERLMQEISRRQQEADLRSYRGALANDMQARGVYGSGNELTMNLAAASEAAQRRALDEMSAQANAQTRAMDALGKATDLSSTIRDSEAQESQYRGDAADIASKFNKELKTRYDEWVAGEKRKSNENAIGRAEKIASGAMMLGDKNFERVSNVANTGLTATGGKTGTVLRGAEPIRDLGKMGIAEADNEETEDKLRY